MDAIRVWLADVAKTPATYDMYRLTAERCLLWSTVECGRPMSELDDKDAQAYTQFLLHLRPHARWFCPDRRRRSDPAWRPFQKPMSPATRDHAIGILSALWDWLSNHGYVISNPWSRTLFGRAKQERNRIAPALTREKRDHIATAIEWSYVESALDEFGAAEESSAANRVRAIFYLAYFADIKPGEMISLRTTAIIELPNEPKPVWTLSLESRSEPRREVVLLPPVQRALQYYLESSGTALWTGTKQFDCPLIASARAEPKDDGTLSKAALHKIAKPLFERAAALAMQRGDTLAGAGTLGTNALPSTPVPRRHWWQRSDGGNAVVHQRHDVWQVAARSKAGGKWPVSIVRKESHPWSFR
jgi:hypothetical protein